MLSFFLVMLLVLRGLAGDAMAMGMLPAMGATSAAATAASPADMALGMPPPAHGMAFLAAPEPALDHDHASHAGSDNSAHHHPGADGHAGAPTHATHTAQAEHCAPADATGPACGDHSHGTPCGACVVCHSAVSPVSLLPAAGTSTHHALPVSVPAHFASAQPLQASKPPIS